MKIASEHTQAEITRKSSFRPVAAAFQSIARLQGTNRRLDARM